MSIVVPDGETIFPSQKKLRSHNFAPDVLKDFLFVGNVLEVFVVLLRGIFLIRHL